MRNAVLLPEVFAEMMALGTGHEALDACVTLSTYLVRADSSQHTPSRETLKAREVMEPPVSQTPFFRLFLGGIQPQLTHAPPSGSRHPVHSLQRVSLRRSWAPAVELMFQLICSGS